MKSQADKLIAKKLSSLDSLPEGYAPNIDSKWAIIQGSSKKAAVINYKVWIGIAACLLILTGSALLWNYFNQPESTIVTQTPGKLPLEQVEKIEPHLKVVTENEQVPILIQPKRKTIRKQAEDVKIVEPEKAEEIMPDLENIQKLEIAGTNQKKSKQRYVEVDFSDPVQPATGQNENNFANTVIFKLNFGKENNTSVQNSSGSSIVRIHRNF